VRDEGLEEDGGDKRAKELQLPPEGRSSIEAVLDQQWSFVRAGWMKEKIDEKMRKREGLQGKAKER